MFESADAVPLVVMTVYIAPLKSAGMVTFLLLEILPTRIRGRGAVGSDDYVHSPPQIGRDGHLLRARDLCILSSRLPVERYEEILGFHPAEQVKCGRDGHTGGGGGRERELREYLHWERRVRPGA